MKNVAVAPGSILWLPDNAETRAVIACANHGALGHPVLVLSNRDVLAGNSQRGRVNVQILIVSRPHRLRWTGRANRIESNRIDVRQITSLGNTSLADKFPGQKRWAVEKRREYLPLKRSPPQPHPDSGVLLGVRITGKAAATRARQSYVHLCAPLVVAHENLVGLQRGTVKLEPRALVLVLAHLHEVCPGVELPPVASPALGDGRGECEDEEGWVEEILEPESEAGELERILGRTNATSHRVSSAIVVRTPVSRPPSSRTPASRTAVSRTTISRTPISRTPVSRPPVSRPPVSHAPVSRPPVSRPPVSRPPVVHTPTVRAPAVRAPAVRTPLNYGTIAPQPAPAPARPPPTRRPIPTYTPQAYSRYDRWAAAPVLEAAGHTGGSSNSSLWLLACGVCVCISAIVAVAVFVGTDVFWSSFEFLFVFYFVFIAVNGFT